MKGILPSIETRPICDRVDGPYDIVMKLFDDNMDMIKESIGKCMTRIGGIESTLTLMAE
jgi:hypothetical protein